MRNLVWLMHISLDGFAAGPDGEMDWAGAAMNDELWKEVKQLMGAADATLFGRRTYHDFENYWPRAATNPASSKDDREFAHWINDMPKFVASNTLRKVEWKNSILLEGDVAAGVGKLKAQPGRDVLLFGSPGLAAHLWNGGFIDQLAIFVHPMLLGAGRPLIPEATARQKLKLESSKKFSSGVVGLRYATVRS